MNDNHVQYRPDGTVWCWWPNDGLVEVIPKSRLDYLHAIIHRARRDVLNHWVIRNERLRAALEQIANMSVDARMLRVAREALERDK